MVGIGEWGGRDEKMVTMKFVSCGRVCLRV